MPSVKQRERRREERCKLAKKVFVVSSEAVGVILDICGGGFSAKFFPRKGFVPEKEWRTDIFELSGILIKDVPVKLKWLREEGGGSALDAYSVQKAGVQFRDLVVLQESQLGYVMNVVCKGHRKERLHAGKLIS